MIIGYILNAIAFVGMVVYIKSIRYYYEDELHIYTIKLRIISWFILLIMGFIPYLGLLVYPMTATFLVQSKIENGRFIIIYSNMYGIFTDIAKALCKPFKCIIDFFDKEI